MAGVSVLFITFFVSFTGILARGSSQLPRGAAPADLALYTADGSGHYTCRDGSKKIPFSRVNDDYCDCEDGSDEPGTSACLQGKFYCKNRGDEPKTLRSMYVDDGVCDCCDGSDEPQGACQDVCMEIGKETLKRVEQELADAKMGLAKRSSLEKLVTLHHDDILEDDASGKMNPLLGAHGTAANSRRSWEKRVAELEKMESAKAQQKAAAEVAKTQAESKLERLRSELSKLESKKQSIAPDVSVDAEDTTAQEGTVEEESKLLVEEDEELLEEDEEEIDGIEEASEEEREETEEERAKRVASQWIPGQGAANDENDQEDVYEPPEDMAPSAAAVESQPELDTQSEPVDDQSDADLGMLFTLKVWLKDQIDWITGKVDVDKKLSLAKSKVDAAQKILDKVRDDFYLKESDLTNLQNEKSELEKKLGREYGPSNVYLSIAESCVEANIDKYVYKICPFGDAFQGENGRNTRLGTWSGFEEDGSVMSFTEGEGCWQGPSRSIKVSIVCGSKDVFESVSEPSRCTYTGVIRTPAYCTEELIKSMEGEVARRKQLLNPETPKEEL